MPLNKLENFIRNTEGRILYVNPNDLDASDSITNQGNSLTKPFKTIQRALLESARFSYLRGADNDIVEKTTILLFPGEHVIDNRPGYAVKQIDNVAYSISPSGAINIASDELSLTLGSNFDITQNGNILHKFNSINGGVVVPRGTSLVGLDLRKTKIRPLYIPNPTDSQAKNSAIFRITGACYFWQFSIFDGNERGLVYTDPVDFSSNNQSKPTFSHHKLTCFEYADGVNLPTGYDITDLDMYYSKLSNAFNEASGRNIDQKYPTSSLGFSKQRPEWEIVGAFATDPINISNIISGDGLLNPSSVITVTTEAPHGLNADTPIKIRGVNVPDYNVSTKVQNVLSATQFTYVLPLIRDDLPAGPSAGLSASGATVTIETDTVSGASPYIFNISLRSVWGMNGMNADGSKASGFRSMVVAQFTAVSLQKDDRAFVKYNKTNRSYDFIEIVKQTGAALADGSSSKEITKVYHLDSDAIYRSGWQPVHIKTTNDAFIQIVSVFAIGFNKHFAMESGGDASITNSNSNFGQYSLSSDGFKKEAFDKDNKAFLTSIIAPRAIDFDEIDVDWIALDVAKTKQVGFSSHLYLFGLNNPDDKPPVITQGYRIGAKKNDILYVSDPSGNIRSANIYMLNNVIGAGSSVALGAKSSEKAYTATGVGSSIFQLGTHDIQTGEKIRVFSDDGDIPENLIEDKVYYAIRHSSSQIKLAASNTNAEASVPIPIVFYGGTKLRVVSRVSDKIAGDVGSPIQWDSLNNGWYIHTDTNNSIYANIDSLGIEGSPDRSNVTFLKRFDDPRSLDEKLYKLRVVVPKELTNARDPNESFIIQESSSTGARFNTDFNLSSLTSSDYLYNRNPRFISTCTYDVVNSIVTVTTELPHNVRVGDKVNIKNITSTTNSSGSFGLGYNGTFQVSAITNDKVFRYSATDIFGTLHVPGTFTNNVSNRNIFLPRFEKNDSQGNLFIYRSEVITPYIQDVQDGVYYLYVLNSSNRVPVEFTDLEFSQKVVDLYPQLDKDNIDDNPLSAVSFAKRSPLGDVVTDDLKKSITRETVDKLYKTFGIGPTISGISTSVSGICTITFSVEHGLNGIVTYSSLNSGTGHTPGTYYNVKLYNENTLSTWDGATAKVVVSEDEQVVAADIISGGSGYTNGEVLYFDSNQIGGVPSARITISNSGISSSVGNVVQFTGIGTVPDLYHRINSIVSKNQISIAKTAFDIAPVVGQYMINVGPSVVTSAVPTYSSVTGIATFSCTSAHGLVIGNRIRLLDSSNNNLGDYLVDSIVSPTSFTSNTKRSFSTSVRVLKHGLSANNATADSLGENLGTRGVSFYQNEILTLGESITNQDQFIVSVPNSGISTTNRFPLGSYIQIDNEIMRIVSSTLSGSGNNKITVIRGSMGTLKENHTSGVLIRKIKPISIELRRPSILRASGHTFEYLGYGPGNYSTGLPQVQVKTLTEREDFLSQSQESSCGSVIYTGMNSDGDFFIGNTKYSAQSGEQVTYDIPVPTVTGQDPSRLSVVFDEVIIKERLLVEGGNSGTVLSQFDGPVNFSKQVKLNDDTIINGRLKVNNTVQITNDTESVNTTTGALIIAGGVGIGKSVNIGNNVRINGTTESTNKDTGALIVEGGVGIEKRLNVGGDTTINGTTQSISKDTGALIVEGGVGIEKNVYIGGILNVTGQLEVGGITTFRSNVRFDDNDHLYFGTGDDLDLYHDGSNSYIDDKGTGSLFIRGAGAGVYIQKYTGESMIDANADGSVTLYHDNSAKLSTTSSGISVTGDVSASGDVIAFASDERLKTNIKPLENALEKVLKLSGFTYNFNEVGEKLGFNTSVTYVGVSAQEVQAVLPEAVKPCPADENYITVQYEKIVPLLIEAIKELSGKVDALEKKIG